MKSISAAVFAMLLCIVARASDDPVANTRIDAPPPPAAVRTFEFTLASLSVPRTYWSKLLVDLEAPEEESADDGLAVFIGDDAIVLDWIDRVLRHQQAIVTYLGTGSTTEGRAWRIEPGPENPRILFPGADDSSRASSGLNAQTIEVGPRIEVVPAASKEGSISISVGYRPTSHYRDVSETLFGDQHLLRTGEIALALGRSLVALTSRELDPIQLIVVSMHKSDDPVTIRSDWPVPYTATVPQSEAQSNLYAEIIPGETAPPGAIEQPDVSTAGTYIELTPGEPQTIEMHEHESRRVSLEKKIKSASGFNPDVIEVTASGTNGLHILSSREGATRLTIVDEDDVPLELTVIVTHDLTDLELLLERLYPDADVEVVPIRDTILLRGTVEDAEQVRQIEEIAEQFAPSVLNQVRSRDESSTSMIPPGFRVVTINPSHDATLFSLLRPGDHVDLLVTFRRQSERGILQTVTETLLKNVEIYSIDSFFSLLVRPQQVEAITSAARYGELSLSWRSPDDVEESAGHVNEDVVRELKGLSTREDDVQESSPDFGAEDGHPAHPAGALDPASRHATDADTERQRGEAEPIADPLVSPGGGSDSAGLTTSHRERDAGSEIDRLREDIRALHEDVRRLLELLEDRQDREADERTQPDEASAEQGASPETSRAWTEIGIQVEEVASNDVRLDDQPYRGAVVITQVRDGSPASRAGLRSGDLLVGLHVWETISPENVDFVLSHPQLSSFTTLKFYVLRGRDTLFGHLQLQERTSLELQAERLFGHWNDPSGKASLFTPPHTRDNAAQPTAQRLAVRAQVGVPGPEPVH